MALLFMDGFDHYGGNDTELFGKWDIIYYMRVHSKAARSGTYGLYTYLGASSTCTSRAMPAVGGIIVGMAVRLTPTQSGYAFFQVLEGAVQHLGLSMGLGADAGKLQIRRGPFGGSTVLATSTTILPLNSWHYIELKAVIDDVAGSTEVRVDGVTDPSLTLTGVDTRNAGGSGQWNRIYFQGQGSSEELYVDDLYVCDTSGAAPWNSFLGPVRVVTLFPQADTVSLGTHANFTPSTGTDHGAMVDEPAANTTDYNTSSVVGAMDSYHYPPLAVTGTILGVQTNLYVQKSDLSARQVCAILRTGGVDHEGLPKGLSPTFRYLSEARPFNPQTGVAWTLADIAAIEAGIKITS